VIVAFVTVIGPADNPFVPLGIVISAVTLLPFVLIILLLPRKG
jgi:hypothetical protein